MSELIGRPIFGALAPLLAYGSPENTTNHTAGPSRRRQPNRKAFKRNSLRPRADGRTEINRSKRRKRR